MQSLPSPLIFVLALALWLSFISFPVFRIFADDNPRKYETIDGLRGFLAISVFAAHFMVTCQWQRSGRWELTPSPAWNAMGHAAVTLFFMITGFLFFGKIANPSQQLGFVTFLKARVLRIYPVYLVCLLCVSAIASVMPDRSIDVFFAVKSIGWWLLFCPKWLFGMDNAGLIVAYTPWSLLYEWCFYLSLPLLAWLWRALRFHPAFPIVLCIGALCLAQWPSEFVHSALSLNTRFIAPFTLGGVTFILLRNESFCRLARSPFGSAVSLAALIAICVRGEPYSVKAYLAMTAAFVPIAGGASLFGLLKTRAMLILGAISYDVYLLHGIVLFVMFHAIAPTILVAMSSTALLLTMITVGLLVVLISMMVHRTIEVPAMSASMRLRSKDPRERLAAP